jgi:hypothetical protein
VSGLHASPRANPNTRVHLWLASELLTGISPIVRRLALVLSLVASLGDAEPNWKEFSLGPAVPKGPINPRGMVRRGILRARSISARTLIGISTGVPPARVLGPDWIDSECYAISAVLADDSKGRLRDRPATGASRDDEFQT